jgi:hypothetical protein
MAADGRAWVRTAPLTMTAWALPGSAHDLTAARTHGIIAALTNADVMTFADKGV